MNNQMALKLLNKVMNWDTPTAKREFEWLQVASETKFDGYTDFRAGVLFIETLAGWLLQFKLSDRQIAYDFVKHRMIYISPPEMQQIIGAFFPEVVQPNLRKSAAIIAGMKSYEIWSTKQGVYAYEVCKRQTLFVGLSDGSRIDVLRRSNSQNLTTEQVVPMMNIDVAKWVDLHSKLSKDLDRLAVDFNQPVGEKTFKQVYLIDDFAGSGTTFIRQVVEKGKLEWKGKLFKFNKLVGETKKTLESEGKKFPLANAYQLHIHHYISSDQAHKALDQLLKKAESEMPSRTFGNVSFGEGLRLPESVKMERPLDKAMLDLCNDYYDHDLYIRLKEHCDEAGQSDMRHGYANCALPLVLDHNTPNNSIPLLWAQTEGANKNHEMKPLFRRRDRHG